MCPVASAFWVVFCADSWPLAAAFLLKAAAFVDGFFAPRVCPVCWALPGAVAPGIETFDDYVGNLEPDGLVEF